MNNSTNRCPNQYHGKPLLWVRDMVFYVSFLVGLGVLAQVVIVPFITYVGVGNFLTLWVLGTTAIWAWFNRSY
mgnify:CR=1 FL=1